MGKLIVFIVIVGAIAFAWHQGYFGKLMDSALDSVDSGAAGMRDAQRGARKMHGDGTAPEKKD